MSDLIENTFIVTSPASLELRNIRGSVEIFTGEDGVISVTAQKLDNTGDAGSTEIEMIQVDGNTVKVTTRYPEHGWGWLVGSHPCKVEYKVRAPRACSLKIHGVSNSLRAEGFEGNFSFNTVSGNMELGSLNGPVNAHSVSGGMELTNVNGKLDLHTVSGAIAGSHLNGPLHLDTVSGKVELTASSLASAEATTVSGRLELHTPLSEGPYRFNTVSGNVDLILPADTRCSAELHAVSGSLSTRLPATSTSRRNGMQVVEVGGGGVKVYAHSVSGNLSLAS